MLAGVFLASFFFEYLFNEAKNKLKHGKKIFIILLTVPILATLVILHPYYLSYYSPLTGGLKKGIYIIEPKWMIGQGEVVKYFEEVLESGELEKYQADQSLDSQLNKSSIKNKLTIGFQEKYYTQIWPFIEEIGGRATIKDITIHAQNSNYFVYPVYDDDSHLEDRIDLELVETLQLRGVNLYHVYKKVY
jgi:hypothetical protein